MRPSSPGAVTSCRREYCQGPVAKKPDRSVVTRLKSLQPNQCKGAKCPGFNQLLMTAVATPQARLLAVLTALALCPGFPMVWISSSHPQSLQEQLIVHCLFTCSNIYTLHKALPVSSCCVTLKQSCLEWWGEGKTYRSMMGEVAVGISSDWEG